ncbi:MAG: hypothetical protein KDD68_16000, partial [Bdellovibrionales bacterium]|nr:hypothetical protein [Bdellovibrionales bacterium]
MTKRGMAILVIVLGTLPMFYNSCSSNHDGDGTYSLLGKNGCGDMSELFARTYHPFLKQHCATCHVPGGLG